MSRRSRQPAVIPMRFWVFAAVSLITSLGAQILAFGIAWEASGSSPALAGVAVAATVAPRVVLPFFSGAFADRYGPARVASLSTASTAVIAVLVAVFASRILAEPTFLLAAAFLLGSASAFTIPALGVIPRILVGPSALTRALAVSTLGQQLVSLLGPTLGGVVVHQFGLTGAATAEALGTTALSVMAFRLRADTAPETVGEAPRTGRVLDGLRVVTQNRVLLLLVLSLVALAGFVLPVQSFLVPVLARHRGWPVQQAGLLAGASTLGSLCVTAVIARLNGSARPGIAAGLGLATTSCCLGLVASMPSIAPAMVAMVGVGAGIALYVGHLGPIMLTAAPPSHLSRVQAVLLVAQSAPLLLVTLVLGGIADQVGATTAAIVCASGVGVAAILVLVAPELRRLRSAAPEPSTA